MTAAGPEDTAAGTAREANRETARVPGRRSSFRPGPVHRAAPRVPGLVAGAGAALALLAVVVAAVWIAAAVITPSPVARAVPQPVPTVTTTVSFLIYVTAAPGDPADGS